MEKRYTYLATVTNVVDGDTVDMAVDLGFNTIVNERFRFLGFDAPETSKRVAKSPEEIVRGLEVKEWLKTTILNKQVFIETHKNDSKDKYGRYLVTILYKNDKDELTDLIDEMIDKNFSK